jgi:hypothetical protein
MRVKYKLAVFIFLAFILSLNAQAFMLIFYQDEPQIEAISYRSIIIYDKENQQIGLIPQVILEGYPKSFCVVVLTPSIPRVNKIKKDIFYDAEILTNPIQRERGTKCTFDGDFLGTDEYEEYEKRPESLMGTESTNERSILIADIITLSNTDTDAPINWLQKNNFKYSLNDKNLIDFYTKLGWTSTVITVDPSFEPELSEQLIYSMEPAIFRYKSESLVYPMRLSSGSNIGRTDLMIYILSNNKMTFSGAHTEYANRIDDNELEKILELYPTFGGIIGQQRCLTKLSRTFSIMEMDMDIEIKDAPNNEEFRKVIYYGISPVADLTLIGLVATIFIIFRTLVKKKEAGF